MTREQALSRRAEALGYTLSAYGWPAYSLDRGYASGKMLYSLDAVEAALVALDRPADLRGSIDLAVKALLGGASAAIVTIPGKKNA